MSRVLIVGSHREHDGEQERFRQICERIGFQLARAGHQIAICSPSSDCADPHVVTGANEAGTNQRPIRVTHFVSSDDLEDLAGDDAYPQEQYRNVELNTVLTHEGWFSTYDLAVENCDIVLALGGTPRGTGGALYIALAKRRPVLAVPGTDGFAHELWVEFEDEYATLPNDDERDLRSHDPDRVANAVTRSIPLLIKHNPFPRQPRGLRYLSLPFAMLALGAVWIYLSMVMTFDRPWTPYLITIPTGLAGLLFRYATHDASSRESYAGLAATAKDATRLFGIVLAVGIVLHLIGAQIMMRSGNALLMSWLSVAGFFAGFQLEQATEAVHKALASSFVAILKGGTQK